LVWEYPNINALAGYLAEGSEPWQVELGCDALEQNQSEPIAIVGIGCRFPGANGPEAFWSLLREGVDAISEVPPERWSLSDFYDPSPNAPGKMNTRWGGFLKNVAEFDTQFFGISPREAARIDPQQRLLLEVAWEALEDSGQIPGHLARTFCGVFIGISTNDYSRIQLSDPRLVDAYLGTGNALSISANRLSYFLDLHGPSVAVDTACSSSLVAVHLACQSLRNGESTLALAGGVNLILSPSSTISFTKAGAMSPDGRCKAFDARANGYVRSEGAGVVVLKPLSRALADGNSIYAVIRGTAINNDGRTNGLMAPNPQAQQAVLRAAYQRSGIAPSQVQYVEAHGSGTFLGDPIEAGALGAVISEGRSSDQPCAIGSVKSNIGHLEAAAGIAGLIKVALALKYQEIPPSLHFVQPNPHIPFAELKLRMQQKLAPWPTENGNAYGGVSSFGFGGTNAHVVLQTAPAVTSHIEDTTAEIADRAYLLPISAHSPEALRALVRSYNDFVTTGTPTLIDLCYSATFSRTHHEHRLSLVAHTTEDLVEQLTAFLEGEKRVGMYAGRSQSKARKLVFVFPGQGSQWRGMGQQLWKQEPVFRASIERTARALSRYVRWSLIEILNSEDHEDPRFDRIDVVQPVLFALQVGLAELWRSWNIQPDAVVGQSMGEVAAAHVAGALSLGDAVRIISKRSRLLKKKCGLGQMMSVDLSLRDAQRLLVGYEDRVSVAVSSSPTATVLSGESAALNELMEQLQKDDIFCAMVKVDVASHSSQMDSLREPLLQGLVNIRPNIPETPLYSTVLGEPVKELSLDAVYWWRNLREPVLFSTAIQNLLADGHDLFLEISAHPVVSAGIQQVLQSLGQKGDVLPSLRREEPERSVLLSSLGALYTNGFEVEWRRLYDSKRPFIKLPSYPWQRERCWLDVEVTENVSPSTRLLPLRTSLNGHPLLRAEPVIEEAAGNHSWEIHVDQKTLPYLRDHRVHGVTIFPATAYLEMVLAAAGQLFGNAPADLMQVEFKETLPIAEEARRVRLVLNSQVDKASTFQFYSQSPATMLEDETWTLNATGQLQCGQSSIETVVPDQISLHATRERCTEEMAGGDFYLELENRGHEYGPSFQAVRRIWRGVGEALGQLEVPATIGAESNGYRIHPALLDACLQLAAATLPFESNSSKGAVYLPVSIRQVHFTGDARTPFWGHASLRENQKDNYEADVLMLDQDGRVIVAVLGLRLRRSGRATEKLTDWFYQVEWQLKPRPSQLPPAESVKGSWLIFVDSIGVGEALAVQLETAGETGVVVTRGSIFEMVSANHYQVDPASPDDFRRLIDEFKNRQSGVCRGIVHLWGLDAAPASATTNKTLDEAQVWGCGSVLSLVQAMAQTPLPNVRLWFVTRGVQQCDSENSEISFAGAPLWGFGGSIAQEFPELRCVNVDLGPGDVGREALSLFYELIYPDEETQIALRGDERHCARLARMTAADTTAKRLSRYRIIRPFIKAQDESFRLEITEPGTLENLELRANPRVSPAAGEVEIEVHAAGLNFVDVLKALGMAPSFSDGSVSLGGECSGKITAVGEGVMAHQVGDEVIAIGSGCFGKYVTTDADLVQRKPPSLTFAEAATIPVAFVTANYALHHLGRLRATERVLIHAASGGVGLAAVQLAQLAGAEVYATAGSEEKREFLRSLNIRHVMDSRTLSFATEVLELTGGKGVDVVLNSLAGEAIPKGMSILSPYGRFLEIGKRDIYQNNHLQLDPFKNNLSFFAIDVERMYRDRPQLVGDIMHELLDRFEQQALKPLPHRIFPITEIESGFRLMAQARHIGKIVFSLNDQEVSIADTSSIPARFKNDCTYLIAGGLGGIGLALAQWMVQRGARHLMLVGRHDPALPARDVIFELQQAGVQVEVHSTDITQPQQVAEVVARIRDSMPPLKGVVHAAGVLDDHIVLQMSHESLLAVMAPKIHGAWNLHANTLADQLDFFVLFSSAASIFGPAGQANYAAGNAFLDALAHHRRALRLPALSINWGRWAEIGLAAAEGRGGNLERQGFGVIKPHQGFEALDVALSLETVPQAVIVPVDWRRFRANGQPTSLVKQLLAEETSAGLSASEKALTGGSLLSVDPEERSRVLQEYLRTQVARVLGIPATRLDDTTPLNKMGLDSVMAVELKYRLEGLGVVIPVVKFLKGASIESLSQLVITELARFETPPTSRPPLETTASRQSEIAQQVFAISPHSPQLDTALQQLSENDLDSLLDKLLAEQASL
jgi:acyl transferase domain-containing protein/aryl carrier-like protein